MCFSQSTPKVPDPAPPPETLTQAAPERPKENEDDSAVLARGTRKYQTKAKKSPSVPSQLALRQ